MATLSLPDIIAALTCIYTSAHLGVGWHNERDTAQLLEKYRQNLYYSGSCSEVLLMVVVTLLHSCRRNATEWVKNFSCLLLSGLPYSFVWCFATKDILDCLGIKINTCGSGSRPTLFFSVDPIIFSTRLTVRPYFLQVVAGCSYSVPKWRLLSH
jgi:hypothetical protein